MNDLIGKTAVITGGSRGLGLGIAQAYAAAGAKVVIASRSQGSVDAAVMSIQAAGGQVCGMTCDVADLEQVKKLAELAIRTFGRLDIWVNNAGIAGPYGATIDWSPETFTQLLQTNILGTYYGSRTAMKHFLAQKQGKLINILGAGWNRPIAYQNAYSSSKAWIRWFTKSLATENLGSGVGVYALNPGMVLTELLTDVEVFEGAAHRLERFPMVVRVMAKSAGVPAAKMVWLASEATDGKTGLEVNVFNPLAASMGFFMENVRTWLKQPEPASGVMIKVIPPFE
jgi:glucose 1-dehydrogenase